MTSSYHPLNCQLYPVNWPKPKWVGWRLKNDQSLSESEWHSVWAQTTLDPLRIYRWPRFSPSSLLLTCPDLAFVLYIFRPFQPFFYPENSKWVFLEIGTPLFTIGFLSWKTRWTWDHKLGSPHGPLSSPAPVGYQDMAPFQGQVHWLHPQVHWPRQAPKMPRTISGSVMVPPPQWYGTPPLPFPPKKLPFACYLQHFRVTASHLHPICSISEPQPSTCLFAAFKGYILPTKYLNVLPACYLHITYVHLCIAFPLMYNH